MKGDREPTTGDWTVERMAKEYFEMRCAGNDTSGLWKIWCEQINAALAAEREKVRDLERITSATGREAKLRTQLDTLVDALKWCELEHEYDGLGNVIRAALSKVKEPKWSKLEAAPLVDALIKIANDPDCDRCQVAVNALAKVKDGK